MQTARRSDQRFWDKLAAKYASQPISDEIAYEQKLGLTRKHLTPESEVFEFGCGTGSTALRHAPYVKYILATDVADNMLDVGRGKAADAGVDNVDFMRTGIEEYDAQGRQFDVVLGLNILHLCRDPKGVTRKVHSLLKPGGYFIQSTACLKDASPILRLAVPVMRAIGKAPFVKFLSEEDVLEMLNKTGFSMVEILRTDSSMAANFYVAQKW
ncbi:class I SAM-dependent methyltransferase [Henriciella marina]|uniref:class I SAM-dependent methyltransferase n=1 Tax=Henriciella marina TaxID=453851 RepID=UPI00037DD004|nr:class I SAM-dependent methyltransferase [Henriciella marina]